VCVCFVVVNGANFLSKFWASAKSGSINGVKKHIICILIMLLFCLFGGVDGGAVAAGGAARTRWVTCCDSSPTNGSKQAILK
jgi:hypothetical protein